MIFQLFLSCKTRFPESKSWALEFGAAFESFDDQKISLWPFRTRRLPSSDTITIPEESLRGFSLLAIHITVNREVVLYQIPKYCLVEFPELKKPILKGLPLESIASGSLMNWVDVMVLVPVQN